MNLSTIVLGQSSECGSAILLVDQTRIFLKEQEGLPPAGYILHLEFDQKVQKIHSQIKKQRRKRKKDKSYIRTFIHEVIKSGKSLFALSEARANSLLKLLLHPWTEG